jgi:hypothetical protein
MGRYSLRDGTFTAEKLTVSNKIPVQYVIPKTIAEGTSAILSGHDFNATGTAAVDNTGLALQPPYPARLVVCANAAGTAGHDDTLAIVGEDAFGNTVSESVYIKGTAKGTTASNNAFAKIDSITPNQKIKSTDIGIGIKKQIGLPYPLAAAGDVISYSYDGSFATAAKDLLTVDTTYNVITLPTMAASKVVQILYKTVLQE